MVKVFILAGGNSTRLFPYSDITEKSMLPIAGKPIIRIIIERLLASEFISVYDITICCLGKHLQNFQHEFRDLEGIRYSPKVEAIGTASHYYYAAGVEQQLSPDMPVLVHYADCLTDLDYEKFVSSWSADMNALLFVTKNVRHEYSEVRLDYTNDETVDKSFAPGVRAIEEFVEKPKMAYHTWTGIAMFRNGSIRDVVGDRILAQKIDFGHDIIPRMVAKYGTVHAYQTDDAWLDLGTANSYRKARESADRGELFI